MCRLTILAALLLLPLRDAVCQRIMEWNVENLFDTRHDSLKEDRDFTPEGSYGWTRGRYWRKLDNIARTIAAVSERSGWPMLVGLCEVENDTVLHDLTKRSPLRLAGYEHIHFEGPDVRGIDVALLYRKEDFQPIASRAIRVPSAVNGFRPTRDILHVRGRCVTSSVELNVFVVHFPSRAGGALSSPHRMLAARTLCEAIDSVGGRNVIVMGDFNASGNDPIFRPIYERVRSVVPQGRKALRKERGTYCYQGVWEFIDHILVSPDLSACVDGTAHVAGYPFLLTENGIPFRTFRGPAYGGGYSDHLPLYMDLSPVKKE